jgi:hypothetical protein
LPPRLVATIGLHASASTWVFNVVRELMIARLGASAVVAAYAEDLSELPDASSREGRHLVIKSHHGSPGLDEWLAAEQPLMVLSVRDPRDACLSMAQRFKAPLDRTAQWISADCDRLERLAQQNHALLRFEDRFFAGGAAAEGLARLLGLSVANEIIEAIAERYTTEAVRSFAQKLAELPPDRVTMVGASHLMDRTTQIHGPHIGDSRSGKWRDLPSSTQAELTRRFAAFLDWFGYQH